MTLTQVTKAGLHDIALDHVYTIGASGTDHYTFQGEGLNGTVNDPTLYLTRGKTYRFENGSGGHPLRIQSTAGASGTAYNTGVTNNAGSGTVIVEVQHDAPDVLYYQCTSHANMGGTLYITGAVAPGSISTAKIADEAVTLAKLEHGTSSNNGKFLRANNGADPSFETVDVTNASNLSTGTVPDAQISSSSVTQHVTAFDDNDILNDISTLALQVNSLQNASKFTSNSVFVDNFTDATGIGTFSNAERTNDNIIHILHNYTTDQYWATTDLDANYMLDDGMTSFTASKFIDGLTNSWAAYKDNATNYLSGFGYEIGADSDFGVGFKVTGADFYNFATSARFSYYKFGYWDSNAASNISNNVQQTYFKVGSVTGTALTNSSDPGATIAGDRGYADNVNGYVGLILEVPYIVPTNTAGVIFAFHSEHRGPQQNDNAGVAEFRLKGQKFVSNNATGHFISNTITAPSSTSSMGAVILYKDTYGTTTLNTDLKVYLSADNGSNFTQGTLTALPSYDSSGTKMAKVNDVSVTAGTQLKYKIEFGNQADFSKEVRITGVSVQY